MTDFSIAALPVADLPREMPPLETSSNSTDQNGEGTKPLGLASVREVFSFGGGLKKTLCLVFGLIFAAVAGAVAPFLIYYFASSFEDLVGDPTSDEFLRNIRELSYTFLVLGVIAFVSLSAYSTLLETMAGEMTLSLKTQWFQALLRQDLAYYDIQDVSGTATIISTNGAKYKRGIGNKLGLFVQFIATFLGGLTYAFYSSWQTSLIVLLTVPFMAVSGWFVVTMNASQTQRANASYAEAGAIVYTTVASIRTILSLNAVKTMIQKFAAGTERAYREAVSQVHLLGLANGSVMASFLLASVIVPLYGGYLLYDQVRSNGCDPSGSVPYAETCDPSAIDIFGAMFGIFLAASVLPQISTTLQAFTEARAACYLAIVAMSRKVGSDDDNTSYDDSTQSPLRRLSVPSRRQTTTQLPKYEIDSSSPDGKKPDKVEGNIEFKEVVFSYPTRQETKVFNGFSLKIEAGKTVAIVGPSGGGKSTIAQLIERFYDPIEGSIRLDGTDLCDLNVRWLRQQIGLVNQEPTLFACSIRENIAHGYPDATDEQVEEAAKTANAHGFIMSFPDGYGTQVGDKGAKISGGQKQRIAIARVLIKNPKILLLDEATSALDSESERVVQFAIDRLLEARNRTTIVIAHRLSTIRNADMIAVVDGGKLIEAGTHEELIEQQGHYYELVEAQKAPQTEHSDSSASEQVSFSASRGSLEKETSDSEEAPVLRFRDVTFTYPSRPDNEVFIGLNLSVRAGETLALVGPSGHGKSSVIQLVERFYDPLEGQIELDGVDLKSLNVKWLRSQVGLVSQEPTLFDTSIAENIRFGLEDVTQEEIEIATRAADAHDFIMSFPDGYDTQVGEAGSQVSGGQKQRICIARVLLRHPRVLLLDEATSALDSESERVVQAALDKIMAMESQTTIVIAHRLSTIRNASRIAVIVEGKVREIGTYEELMSKHNGQFRRLQAFQSLESAEEFPKEVAGSLAKPSLQEKIQSLKEKKRKEKEKKEKELEELERIDKEREKKNAITARQLAKDDWIFFLIGGIGGVLAGLMFPVWGFIFAYTIELLYKPVFPCEVDCQEYWDSIAEDMKDLSIKIALTSVGTIVTTLVGHVLLFYGFGTATERMNKRVRDAAFNSLVRQEVGFFDLRPVGGLTSQLQDDAALIHAFSGEPIRTLVINLSSVLVGVVVGFFYMWPFALVFCGILPFMGFGAEMEMRMYYKGEDEGDDTLEKEHSPGGIVIESLVNIRTVASLTMEELKLREYTTALRAEDPTPIKTNFLKGSGFGLGQFFQFWGIALMIWFGAWVLHNYPNQYEFRDFNISMFALFFSLYGLTVALEGATDRTRAKLAAGRIFELTERRSAIDPLREEGLRGEEVDKPKTTIGTGDERELAHKSREKLHSTHEKPPQQKSIEELTSNTDEICGKPKSSEKHTGSDEKPSSKPESKREVAPDTDEKPAKHKSSKKLSSPDGSPKRKSKKKVTIDVEDEPSKPHSPKNPSSTKETSTRSKNERQKEVAADDNGKPAKRKSSKMLASPDGTTSKPHSKKNVTADVDKEPSKPHSHKKHPSHKLASPDGTTSKPHSNKNVTADVDKEPAKPHSHKKHSSQILADPDGTTSKRHSKKNVTADVDKEPSKPHSSKKHSSQKEATTKDESKKKVATDTLTSPSSTNPAKISLLRMKSQRRRNPRRNWRPRPLRTSLPTVSPA